MVAIHARSGLDVHHPTLAGWVGRASFHIRPLYECLASEPKKLQILGVDETPVQVLDPKRGRTKTGYMRTMARDEQAWCRSHSALLGQEPLPGLGLTPAQV